MIDDQKQWFLLWLLATWRLSALLLPIVTFWLTRNVFSLSLCGTLTAPVVILLRITRTLLPPDDNETKIAVRKGRRKGL